MQTQVVNLHRTFYDVFIGRPSKWGNPFSLSQYSREEAISRYRAHVKSSPELMGSLHELKGKRLGCFCKPRACHGDVLVELIEQERLFEI